MTLALGGVVEIAGLLNLASWPKGMWVIARRERPRLGAELRIAELRITDADGLRVIGLATNTASGGPGGPLADLELRHRRRARAEDRIRVAKDTLRHEAPCRIPGGTGRNSEGGFWV